VWSVSNVIIWNLEEIKVELTTDVLINISENKPQNFVCQLTYEGVLAGI